MTKVDTRGWHRRVSFDEAAGDIYQRKQGHAPDRAALELYESPDMQFIGRPMAEMSAFHLAHLNAVRQQSGRMLNAMTTGTPYISPKVDAAGQAPIVGIQGPQGDMGGKGGSRRERGSRREGG